MTLIAALRPENCPIVFGDLLLSGEEVANATIPSIGPVTSFFPPGSGWSIVGLRQKVATIKNCAIAWSGNRVGAGAVIGKLRELADQTPLSREIMSEFWSTIPAELATLDTSFVAFLTNPETFDRFWFGGDVLHYESEGFGQVSIGGSGHDVLLPALQRGVVSMGSDTSPTTMAVSLSAAIAAILWADELKSQRNLLLYFGGGYEVAFPNRYEFQKFSDMTFLFWRLEKNGKFLITGLPQMVVKQQYVEDVLLLKTARLKRDYSGRDKLLNTGLHVVLPAYRSEPCVDLPDPSCIKYESQTIVHCFDINLEDGGQFFYSEVQGTSATSPSSVIFDERGDVVHAEMTSEFVEALGARVSQMNREVRKPLSAPPAAG